MGFVKLIFFFLRIYRSKVSSTSVLLMNAPYALINAWNCAFSPNIAHEAFSSSLCRSTCPAWKLWQWEWAQMNLAAFHIDSLRWYICVSFLQGKTSGWWAICHVILTGNLFTHLVFMPPEKWNLKKCCKESIFNIWYEKPSIDSFELIWKLSIFKSCILQYA